MQPGQRARALTSRRISFSSTRRTPASCFGFGMENFVPRNDAALFAPFENHTRPFLSTVIETLTTKSDPQRSQKTESMLYMTLLQARHCITNCLVFLIIMPFIDITFRPIRIITFCMAKSAVMHAAPTCAQRHYISNARLAMQLWTHRLLLTIQRLAVLRRLLGPHASDILWCNPLAVSVVVVISLDLLIVLLLRLLFCRRLALRLRLGLRFRLRLRLRLRLLHLVAVSRTAQATRCCGKVLPPVF